MNKKDSHALWYSCERVSKTDKEDKKLLNQVILFSLRTKIILIVPHFPVRKLLCR